MNNENVLDWINSKYPTDTFKTRVSIKQDSLLATFQQTVESLELFYSEKILDVFEKCESEKDKLWYSEKFLDLDTLDSLSSVIDYHGELQVAEIDREFNQKLSIAKELFLIQLQVVEVNEKYNIYTALHSV